MAIAAPSNPAPPQSQQVTKRPPPAPAPLELAKSRINSEKFLGELKAVLPPGVCTPTRAAQILCLVLTKKPELADPKVNQASLFQSMLDSYRMGIEPDGRLAHLILYNTEVKLMLDYKGLIELITRSPKIEFIDTFAVYSNDKIHIQYGCEPKIEHTPEIRGDRGELIGTYAVAHIKGCATRKFVWLPKEEIDKVRASSKAANSGPWVEWYSEMAKKTAIRRISKTLPLEYETADAIDRDMEVDNEEDRFRSAKRAKVAVESALPQVAPQAQLPPPPPVSPAQQPPATPGSESKPELLKRILGEEGIDEVKFIAFATSKFGVSADVTSIEELADMSPRKLDQALSQFDSYKAELKSA